MGRKWANIVAKKTAKDGANSKVYAKFGVEIYVAAKKGDPDPESNTALKFVIDRAKQAQVPKHVIDKAIDKAKGNTDETFTEGRYEGFGPNGSMLIVDTLTSNVNRTAANVRAAFGKNGGNMGASGSVAYLFDNKGVIVFAGDDADSVFEQLLEADVDVDDVEVPVEIQFITKDERRRARTGEVSHIAYKYLQSQGFGKDNLEKETTRQRVERMKIVSLAKEVLGDLHKRRYDMINSKITGKLGINPKSLSSEDKFIERLIDLRADN